jgi:GNAT superfamily N-acetyltransferase
VHVRRMGASEARYEQQELAHVYRAAWGPTRFAPAEDDIDSFGERLVRHSSNPDFTVLLADVDSEVVGFAYGYTSVPGGWWRQTVSTSLDNDSARKWFEDCFEFAELAVVPEHQRHGIGGALHNELLAGLPHQSAMLSTQRDNWIARAFYAHRGWIDVIDGFDFPNKPYPYAILGLDLRGISQRRREFSSTSSRRPAQET